MFLDSSNPINMAHECNRGLVSCHAMLPDSYTRGRIRCNLNRHDMTVGSGSEIAMVGPTTRAIKFANSNLTIPASVHNKINGVGKISIGMWIYPTSFGSYKCVFDSTNRHTSFFINAATDLYVGFGGTAGGITATASMTLNEWQWVVVVYDAFNVFVYRNGAMIGTRTLGNTVFTDTIVFGTNPSTGGSNYQGWQAGHRVWAKALSAAVQVKLYKQAKQNFKDMYNWLPAIKVRERDPEIVCDTGYYTFAGQAANLITAYGIEAESGSYSFVGQAANLSLGYTLVAGTGSYDFVGQAANLHGNLYDAPTSRYIGRFRRGQNFSVYLIPSELLAECPTLDIYHEGTTLIRSVQMPANNRSIPLFSYKKFIDADFIDGHYVGVITARRGIDTTQHLVYFEVTGGEAIGSVVGVTELQRPLGRAVVMQRDDGNIAMGYKPRVE